MRRTWITPLSIAAVLLVFIAAFIAPTGATLARWYEEFTTDEVTATSDEYTFEFADKPDFTENPDPASPPTWNHPGIEVTNDSQTLSRQMRITRTTLTNRYRYGSTAPNIYLDPIRNSRIVYTLAPAGETSCHSKGHETVWTVKQDGIAAPAGGVYTAPTGGATFTLPPGETRLLCMRVDLNTASITTEDRRVLLRRFAGAGIRANTEVEAAQNLSTDGTESADITSFYRVALPQPIPSPNFNSSNGTIVGCVNGRQRSTSGYMRLVWEWSASTTTAELANIIDRWEVWSRPTGGSWAKITDSAVLRKDDGLLAERFPGGNIPEDQRQVFVERGIIRGPGLNGVPAYRDFVIVGVMKNIEQTKFVISEGWNLSWDGDIGKQNYRCESNIVPTTNLTGGPNMPGKEW